MIPQHAIDLAMRQIAVDLSAAMPGEQSFQRLVSAIATVLPGSAVALFQLQDGVLFPVASQGLAPELRGRQFLPSQHPRLQAIMASDDPVRFAYDCDLPDPFDGLLASDVERELPVHSCMGCRLSLDGEPVGILTLDALAENAFAGLTASVVAAFAALATATLRNAALLRALELSCEHQRAIAHDLMREALRRGGELIGDSAPMRALRQDIALVAATDLPVLVGGETGSGKELAVRTLHACSARRDQALVQINCAALPESLAESELFGHKKGAFTGAIADRAGKFELAHGGTLFLDEIGELAPGLQALLLRALQQGEIQRVGSDAVIRVDVRIVAATNRDLLHEVEAGRFRADLYHRLHVYPLHLPALRERREDIAELAGHFLDAARPSLGGTRIDLHPSALEALQAYDWPGNVRELEHLLLRASLRARQRSPQRAVLFAQDLELPAPGPQPTPAVATAIEASAAIGLRDAVDDLQRRMIVGALASEQGNWTRAAARLELDRANLQRLARRLGVSQ
ncbi:nitric oxide reductase transcriptional regulator NorR [Paludibacterium yongneupense]|uniref:nitric oxide reductase transcriptional regulator NorR n=1 Tax=Paludibacterium yongneupense TaxID=400061 RepID=UPI00040AB2C4|nr:nitric oxide reductase transcriptional regulator NorR [Paludibacterium yongneupense]